MLHFDSDYLEGAHPLVLQRLIDTNLEQTTGYGLDPYCESARSKIRAACGQADAEVFFVVGGTQANASVIDSLLRPWQSVLSAETGHIATHEAGAIEATGHKVVELSSSQGKVSAETLRGYLDSFFSDPTHAHMPVPGLVYLSYPSEYGTLYSKSELEDIRQLCDDRQLFLYLDGARLGYGLVSPEADLDMKGIAELCDAFSLGGTKVGALFGEAVVFPGRTKPEHFFTLMKQRGAVLAKGRLLGLQFDTLFDDDLYYTLSRHALRLASRLKEAFIQKGYALFLDAPTNQLFVVLDNRKLAELEQKVGFSFWEQLDKDHTVVRFATSWATREEDVDALIGLL